MFYITKQFHMQNTCNGLAKFPHWLLRKLYSVINMLMILICNDYCRQLSFVSRSLYIHFKKNIFNSNEGLLRTITIYLIINSAQNWYFKLISLHLKQVKEPVTELLHGAKHFTVKYTSWLWKCAATMSTMKPKQD